MSAKLRFLETFLSSILFLGMAAPAVANDITVTVQPWGQTQVNTFDPNKAPGTTADPNKPGDLPGPPVNSQNQPLIPPNESAVAVADLDPNFTVDTSAPDTDGKVTITHIDVTIAGSTTIYLPAGATQQLKDHENGHNDLYKDEYDKNAKQKLTEAVKSLVGNKFPNADGAKDAVQKALDDRGDGALMQQMGTSGDKYDTLTNHGRNDKVDPKTNKAVDTPTGVAMTKAEQDMAPPAGQSPGKPDMSNTMAATAPDPARVFFDLATSRLSLGGDLTVTNTTDALDPIIGRGIFEFDPMILIGPTDNGAIHLSDTTFRILDTQTGDSLLSAFLLEVAYMPSTLPGFAGMIQAYLDIPPDFAGGISNTINSPFLDGMSAASAVGEQTTFWFFADQPLFDSQGTPQISGSGGAGNLKIGIAIPEPSTVVLLFGGALGYLPLLYRKRSRMAPHSKSSPRRLLA